eukprot:13290537-Alexandrium_andersonii.AAC.1
MSASLVGSEMCIRDRRWRRHLGVSGGAAAAAPLVRAEKCSKHCGARLRVCLLYTSDAADDM